MSRKVFGILLKVIGIVFVFISVTVVVGVVVAAIEIDFIEALENWRLILVGAVVTIVIGVLGKTFASFGSKIYTLSAQEVLANDSRPPVLYLRSFSKDNYLSPGNDFNVGMLMDAIGGTLEQKWARIFKKIGPTIAVRNKENIFHTAGAGKLKFNDNEWKNVVQELILRSSYVIVHAAGTKGLLWELSMVKKILMPHQLVIVFNDPAEWNSHVAIFSSIFGRVITTAPKKSDYVYFINDWKPHFGRSYKFFLPQPELRGFYKSFSMKSADGSEFQKRNR